MLAEAPGCICHLSADNGYDADWLRADLRAKSIAPAIPGTLDRKKAIRRDKRRYRERWRIEPIVNRLTDFGRSTGRHDKLARNCGLGVALAAVIASWC
ncbi:hypothetical protein MOX02_54780 [Methylobacterium oxalidis]|uniref:Transposase DDE domain-containing protein n=1 Tax=Methylobacterium oxalidis TaxID=944322 RepID=A0A512JBW1_9HYPH|nr:hypothetical protein MOX02_54780 [Methylobacterium oxalidis]GJE32577.1 IS5 family transposase ISMpo7 [Methylobacterium oxalidis]GLS63821.1 hypothetical protein GCM10007888_22020 [Methylobacterium oxalidis]